LRVTELVHNVDKVNALVSPTSDAKLKEEPSDTKVAMPTPQIPAKITPIPSSP